MKNTNTGISVPGKGTIGGVRFEIDADGHVRTRECGDLGHEEDVLAVGSAFVELIAVLESIQE